MYKTLISLTVLNILTFVLAVFFFKHEKIVTLDSYHIIKYLANDLAKRDLDKDVLEKLLKEKIEKIDATILKLSKDKGYAVLSKSAVLSQHLDITEDVINEVLNEK